MGLRSRLAALETRLADPRASRPWRLVAEARVLRFLLAVLGDRPPESPPAQPRVTAGPFRWEEPAPANRPRTALLRDLHAENVSARRELARRLIDQEGPRGDSGHRRAARWITRLILGTTAGAILVVLLVAFVLVSRQNVAAMVALIPVSALSAVSLTALVYFQSRSAALDRARRDRARRTAEELMKESAPSEPPERMPAVSQTSRKCASDASPRVGGP